MIDELYDEFVQKFTESVLSTKVGSPTDPDTTIGPLSSLAAADRLSAQVDAAVAGGATPRRRQAVSRARFSTRRADRMTPDNPSYNEELFGPVAIVHKVSSEEKAVELANDTPFGLGSYVFTTDPDQAARVADTIQAGMVYVNIVGADGPESIRRSQAFRLRS